MLLYGNNCKNSYGYRDSVCGKNWKCKVVFYDVYFWFLKNDVFLLFFEYCGFWLKIWYCDDDNFNIFFIGSGEYALRNE